MYSQKIDLPPVSSPPLRLLSFGIPPANSPPSCGGPARAAPAPAPAVGIAPAPPTLGFGVAVFQNKIKSERRR